MLAIAIVLLVLVLDQWTKAWIMGRFALYEVQEVIPGLFNLTHLTNLGSAFGFLNSAQHGQWRHVFFVSVAVLAMACMVGLLWQMRREGRRYVVSISLILGGAAGNLIDRLRLGAVVDFLDFYWRGYHWPAFNVADSAITVGVGLFLVAQVLQSRSEGH